MHKNHQQKPNSKENDYSNYRAKMSVDQILKNDACQLLHPSPNQSCYVIQKCQAILGGQACEQKKSALEILRSKHYKQKPISI